MVCKKSRRGDPGNRAAGNDTHSLLRIVECRRVEALQRTQTNAGSAHRNCARRRPLSSRTDLRGARAMPAWFTPLQETASRWSEHKDARLGAALAYYSIFSIGPLIVIAITIAG